MFVFTKQSIKALRVVKYVFLNLSRGNNESYVNYDEPNELTKSLWVLKSNIVKTKETKGQLISA